MDNISSVAVSTSERVEGSSEIRGDLEEVERISDESVDTSDILSTSVASKNPSILLGPSAVVKSKIDICVKEIVGIHSSLENTLYNKYKEIKYNLSALLSLGYCRDRLLIIELNIIEKFMIYLVSFIVSERVKQELLDGVSEERVKEAWLDLLKKVSLYHIFYCISFNLFAIHV